MAVKRLKVGKSGLRRNGFDPRIYVRISQGSIYNQGYMGIQKYTISKYTWIIIILLAVILYTCWNSLYVEPLAYIIPTPPSLIPTPPVLIPDSKVKPITPT